MLKKFMLSLVLMASAAFAASSAYAQVYVRGHYRSNGSYVQPHYRSSPDSSFYNNWSTYPNINPYTGRMGTRYTPSYNSYRSYSYPSYGSYWSW